MRYRIEHEKRNSYLQVTMSYCIYYINTKAHNITETIFNFKATAVSVKAENKSNSSRVFRFSGRSAEVELADFKNNDFLQVKNHLTT